MRSPAAFTLSEERNVTSSHSCRLFHVTLRQINRPASDAKNSIYLFIYATKCCLSISILDRVGSNSSDSGAIVLTQLVSTCIVIHEHVISLYSLTLQIKYQIIHRTYKMCYSCLSFCETRQKKTAHWTEHQLEHFICDFVYHAVI